MTIFDNEDVSKVLTTCVLVTALSPFSVSFAAEEVPPSCQLISSKSATDEGVSPDLLESERARIGKIKIVSKNIFDNDDPNENLRLHRWANALHITTKSRVISAQLLFRSGDTYSKQLMEETARLLRSNRYLREAEVVAVDYDNGEVDLEVRTLDVWTLSPSLSFGRGGGKNSGGIGIKEFNLLGSGTSIGASYKSNVDRDTLSLKYFNRNFLLSRYQLIGEYTDASDGYVQRLGFEQPFFALDTKRAGGARIRNGRRTESLYDAGNIAAQFEHTFAENEVYIGWSEGLRDGWSRRFTSGVSYNSHDYNTLSDGLYAQASIPGGRRFIYPFVGVELLQDDYVTTRNFDQMNRTEDRHLGLKISFRIGYADGNLGSSTSAWLYRGDLSSTVYHSPKSTLVVEAKLGGRVEGGASKNAKLSVFGRYDKRQSENRLLHIALTASAGDKLDIENTTYIGGDSGLRGYPLRYQAGDSSVLFTVEQRLYTDWSPFQLFNVGGAAFFDMGRSWGADPVSGKNYGWLRNVGVGLRIGSTRSGIGRVIHIDLAYPLDGGADISKLQFLVEARKGF